MPIQGSFGLAYEPLTIHRDRDEDGPAGFTMQRNDDSIVPLPRDTRMPSNPRLAGEEAGRSSAWISFATGTQIVRIISGVFTRELSSCVGFDEHLTNASYQHPR